MRKERSLYTKHAIAERVATKYLKQDLAVQEY